MNVKNMKKVVCGPVNSIHDVSFSVTKEEAEELRNALKIINKYRLGAYKALKHNPKNADFTSEKYCVKNDLVVVTVEYGAIG